MLIYRLNYASGTGYSESLDLQEVKDMRTSIPGQIVLMNKKFYVLGDPENLIFDNLSDAEVHETNVRANHYVAAIEELADPQPDDLNN